MEFFFERAQHAEIIGVAAVEGAVAADDHGVNSANFRRERIAVLQILENGLLVWMSDTESADTKFGYGRQKIGKVMHEEWEIDGIDATRYEPRVVQKRRKRMSDGIANHSVDLRATRESVRPIQMLHLVQGNLARGGSGGDGRVSQRTSLAQGEDARGQADLSHGDGDKAFRITRQAQQPDAVLDGSCFGRDFDGVDAAMCRGVDTSREVRRVLKVVNGEQDARRHGIFPHGLTRKLAQSFHFKITPLATSFACLDQPVEFAVNAAGKLAPAFAAAAGGEKCSVPRMGLTEPAEELSALRVTAEPVETQFDGAGLR